MLLNRQLCQQGKKRGLHRVEYCLQFSHLMCHKLLLGPKARGIKCLYMPPPQIPAASICVKECLRKGVRDLELLVPKTGYQAKKKLPTGTQGSQLYTVCTSLTHQNQTKINPLELCQMHEADPLNWLTRGVFTL